VGVERMTRDKIVDRLVSSYLDQPVIVAGACDNIIDTSGQLLGWIREEAEKKIRMADRG
jgi:hypothetical protein